MKNRKKILIIGAGPTGLGAAFRLRELGYENFTIYEKNSYAGGLCASFRDNKGFTWDLGGHVIFSRYKYFHKFLKNALDNELLERKRQTWIRTMDRWVPYPFQNNIRYLPKNIFRECLQGLKNVNQQRKKSINFEEWIINNLGEGIAKYFMLAYNLKVWAYPLNKMSVDWIKERVSSIKLKDIVTHSIIDTDQTDWGQNVLFRYPLYGGVGEIFKKISASLSHKIKFNLELIKIDPKHKKIYLSNGREDTYGILINTSPIDKFLKLIEGCSKDLLSASSELKHNSVFVVGVGINRSHRSSKCWIYCPDNKSPFFRVTYLSNYSPHNIPDNKKYYSLLCESAYSEYKKEDKSKIFEKTIQGLINSGLIDRNDIKIIVSRFLFDIDYAYPIPTLQRDGALKKIQAALENIDIYSRGRFGSWKYEIGNTDHSVMQGKEVVDKILGKGKEHLWSL